MIYDGMYNCFDKPKKNGYFKVKNLKGLIKYEKYEQDQYKGECSREDYEKQLRDFLKNKPIYANFLK